MWKKENDDCYYLNIDPRFKIRNDLDTSDYFLINLYNGEEAKLEGKDISEVLDDAFDLILARFMSDTMKLANNAKILLNYIDDFVNKAIEIDENFKPLGTMPAELKQKALEILIESKLTNHLDKQT